MNKDGRLIFRDCERLRKPLVTIGICVRNCEDSIKDAIDSIVTQDFPHNLLESIFVDGRSDDGTLKVILDSASTMNMSVKVFCQERKGLGAARNVVVNNTSGDYIVWVDGDMVLSRDFIRKLVEFMRQNPKVGIAKGKHDLTPGGNWIATLEMYSRAASKMVDYQSKRTRLKALGTSGCIYRMEAVSQAGHFDENLRGYGEDQDFEIRIRDAGWSFSTVDAKFSDYERHKLTWKHLWSKYWLRGYFSHYFLHKNRGFLKHYRMFPPAAFVAGIFQSHTLFRLTYQKKVFLLPFQHAFKISAWYFGFIRSHMKSYQLELA
jgi:glycosyltransferase involved in cell wall biosynthesis